MMDANEHVLDCPFIRRLQEELDLEEIYHKALWGSPPITHISVYKLIDGVWASRSLEIGSLRFYHSPKVLAIIEQWFLMSSLNRV